MVDERVYIGLPCFMPDISVMFQKSTSGTGRQLVFDLWIMFV